MYCFIKINLNKRQTRQNNIDTQILINYLLKKLMGLYILTFLHPKIVLFKRLNKLKHIFSFKGVL